MYPKCTERTTPKPCRAIYNQSNLWDSESKHVFHSRKGHNTTHLLEHWSVEPIPDFTCTWVKSRNSSQIIWIDKKVNDMWWETKILLPSILDCQY
jgi:hypothetical protein